MKHPALTQSGVSLIEALVAMAIMAFGMLALLGLQGALRGNSDVSKQRSEAVRYAQEEVELLRTFSTLETPGTRTYTLIAPEASAAVSLAGYTSSANFTREVGVTDFPPSAPNEFDLYYVAAHKNVVTRVSWTDRNNDVQWVQLNTIIARTAPEIIGAMSVSATGSAVQGLTVGPVLPNGAIDQGDGTSNFRPAPLASPGIVWVLNNASGLITRVCNLSTCTTVNMRLLAGYVRFALDASQPLPADSAQPTGVWSEPIAIGVRVNTTSPTVGTVTCLTDSDADMSYTAYFCAVPVTVATPKWSGQSLVTLNGQTVTGGYFATSVADARANLYRVCRYTALRSQLSIPNAQHPFEYAEVSGALINQNFLIIRAGNGSVAFDCPDDDLATPINGRTWHHQPSTAT